MRKVEQLGRTEQIGLRQGSSSSLGTAQSSKVPSKITVASSVRLWPLFPVENCTLLCLQVLLCALTGSRRF